ncbi:MAG: phosphoribosylformylglycinamidine synthase II [Verrucomicrobiales bacterium]|jgi:phosphoribosylformylglycinamidine synthase II
MAEPLHRALGLTDDEAESIDEILGRQANPLELSMYSVMWSEHCSYKSSRIHLKRLPTEAPWVIVGPGENAGVVDLGDGIAGAFRIESHNHPSAIEPYQGAATGAGGILRDIFTMGARPIALMDPLRFGPIDDARSRWIAEGVVSGISGYGNSVGVPTVGGETIFDETYKGNPLVNVFCLGTMPTERLVLGEATGLGNVAILFGSATGRDGIGGVSVLASAGFDDSQDESAKRPSVQVGDPYEEKRLIEACLELLNEGLVVGIQDLGGAGFVCATSETASRGGMGMDVDVTAVHRRQEGMEPFEVMTSESQERMLAIVEPDGVDRVLELCAKWEVQASVVGKVVDGGALRILDGWDGEELANIPASSLHDAAPLYDRPMEAPDRSGEIDPATLDAPTDLWSDLTSMLMDTSWVHNQYDSQLFLNTVVGPGSDATLLRLKHPTTNADTGRGIAMTTDGNHHWCIVNPFRGTAMTVAESILNLACVGAAPLALVNNLNFGNPEHPVTMWQLSQAVDGMAEACSAFTVPVVGGNVSLYNEANGKNIDPTPVVGTLGMTETIDHVPPGMALTEGHRIIVLGPEGFGLGGSMWARGKGALGGDLPELDYEMHLRVAEVTRKLVSGGVVSAVHDVGTGGLGVAIAEMAIAGEVGVIAARIKTHDALFSEAASRVVVAVSPDNMQVVENMAESMGVPVTRLGLARGDQISFKGLLEGSLADATSQWRDKLPAAMGAISS